MLKMTIDNEEVVSDKDITINEEMLSASSTILNNVYPKEWEEDKDYTSRFYYPQDYSKALIQRSYVTQEAEAGTTIQVNGSTTLTDVDTTKNSRVLRLLGQTSQNGTPTPTSPIPVNVVSGDNEIVVCGKNICFTDFGDWESGEYNSSGNKGNNTSRVRAKDLLIVRQSTTYYFDTSSGNDLFIVREYDKNKTFIKNDGIIVNGGTITTMSNCYFLGITLFSNTNQTRSYDIYQTLFEESSIKPFICLNSVSNKTYEPYIGNTYNIDLPVENLFDDSNISNKWVGQTGNIIGATGSNVKRYNATPNEYITLSAKFTNPTSNSIIVLSFYDSNDVCISRYAEVNNTNLVITKQTPTNASYYYAGRYTNTPSEIQLEKGSKQNSYTPYGTTPIELCKIGNYQDYIYKDSDKWYLHKEIGKYNIDTSTLGIKTNYTNIEYATIPKPNNYLGYGSFDRVEIICKSASHIAIAPSGWNDANLVNKISGNPEANRWWLGFSKGTGITAIQNALNGSYIYYPLTTPTNTEITYAELLNQLNALSSQ